jgi:hypothetical protein
MAKKQLKKINQPKKYLQGGSNMNSVSMMRQNPYYLGQVEQREAESRLDATRQQAMGIQQTAVQAKKDSEAQAKASMDQSLQQSVGTLGQAAVADKKAGNLGKFFIKNPTTVIGNTNPFAFMQAPTQAIGTGTGIEGVGVLAPEYMPAAQAGLGTAADAGVGVLAPEFIAPAADAGSTVASTGSTAAGGLSGLASAGIGVAANIGGTVIKNRTNDDNPYTFTDKERRGNVGGSALASAGTGFGIGNMILPGVGGLIGAGIGAGVGAIKARKENKAAKEEADRLQREQAAIAGAYQSAYVNSRLSGVDTGFGYNSSTNMNNQATNQYQVARLGGTTGIQEDRRTKKVPGGKIVPIEGTDAVEFVGRSHEKGGVTIDKNTEVEGGETMDQVAMNNNNKQDYIFSKYLKLGGKSFAQRHKEILKGSGSQADIQQLAAMQEKMAGRNPQQVAAYGGFHKYLEGGVKPCPECPPGTICDVATGACVPDEDSGSGNSYDWNATGVEGFKAKQNAAAPAATAGKQVSQADYDFFIREKNAKLADEQNKIAAQNGTANAPADATAASKPKGWGAAGAPSSQVDVDQPAYTDPTGVKPAVNTAASITDMASLDAAWEAGQIGLGDYSAKRKELQAAAPATNTTIANQQPANQTNSSATTTSNAGTPPIDQEEQDWRNYWISQGYVFNAAGERELPPGKKLVVNDDGSEQIVDDTQSATGTAAYTTPAGITPNGNKQSATQTDNTVAPDGTKLPAGYVWDATLNAPVSSAAMTASSTSKGGNAPNAKPDWDTQKANIIAEINASPDALIDPAYKGRLIANLNSPDPKVRDQAMYDFNIHSVTQVGQTVDPKVSPAIPYSSAPGVVAPFGPTQPGATTGTQTPASTSNVQGGVGATTTSDKLVGSKTSGFLPTFENAKENPLWKKENYPTWKSDVHSAITDADRQQKIVDYLSNYKGDYAAEVQKRIKGKSGQDLLTAIETLATDGKPGIFHEAVRQALEASKPPAPVVPPVVPPKPPETPTEPLPEKFTECPPGTYRSTDGTCKPLGDVPQKSGMSGTMLAGLGQLIPVGAALMNPYKIAPGIAGAPAVKGSLMPRMNLNQERASAIQQNVAYKNAVLGQNAGPAALVAMQSANAKTDQQMMQIAKQEQDTNRQLAAEEGKLGMQASMFNAESQQKTQMFNKEFNQKERQYRREDILGALDTGAARIAGIVKDDRNFKAQERLATALDETGSYDRFSILEQLNKEAKRKGSPYYGTTEAERRRMASAMYKELNPEGYVSKSEYTKLQEEKEKIKKEKEELEKAGKAKFGGARQYVSRLGQLSGVRATKAKL